MSTHTISMWQEHSSPVGFSLEKTTESSGAEAGIGGLYPQKLLLSELFTHHAAPVTNVQLKPYRNWCILLFPIPSSPPSPSIMCQYQAWRNLLPERPRHPTPCPGPPSHPLLASQTSGTLAQQPGTRSLHPRHEAGPFTETAQPNPLSPPAGSCSWSSTDIALRTAASGPADKRAPGLAWQRDQNQPDGLGRGARL